MAADGYNQRVAEAILHLKTSLPSFAVVEQVALPQQEKQKSVILVEKGRFYGMGYIPANVSISGLNEIKTVVTPYPENGYIRGLINSYALKFPNKKFDFTETA